MAIGSGIDCAGRSSARRRATVRVRLVSSRLVSYRVDSTRLDCSRNSQSLVFILFHSEAASQSARRVVGLGEGGCSPIALILRAHVRAAVLCPSSGCHKLAFQTNSRGGCGGGRNASRVGVGVAWRRDKDYPTSPGPNQYLPKVSKQLRRDKNLERWKERTEG